MGSWRSSKGDAAAQHHTLIATDNWRMETEVSSLRPSLVLSWGPWSLRLGLRHTTAPPTTALAQFCFLKKFYLWVPGFPGKCKSPHTAVPLQVVSKKPCRPLLPFSLSHEPIQGSPRAAGGENHGSFLCPAGCSLAPAPPLAILSPVWSFQSVSACSKHALSPRPHEGPVHGNFLSGARQGCLSGPCKFSPEAPFLCGCQPTHWLVVFLRMSTLHDWSQIPMVLPPLGSPRAQGIKGVRGTSKKVLSCCCPGAPFLCGLWHGLAIIL